MTEQRRFLSNAPENSETPLDVLCSWVTPTRLFFVRNHFEVPVVDPEWWRLTLDGCVKQPASFTLKDLEARPQKTVFTTVECAGNGRSYLQPPQHGVQWRAGAIAHAEWTGVPLHTLLKEAGLSPDAVEIVFTGADVGKEADQPEPAAFARSVPLAKALHPDTLLALRMNGERLTGEHGAPVRLLVPGWYGVASVKWLTRMEAVREPFRGYYQTKKYTVKRQTAHGVETQIVQSMAVKSEIIRPWEDETLGVGSHRIFGVAWAGEEAVKKVEVSADGGQTWGEAALLSLQAPYSWSLWEYFWEAARPGEYQLLARATSASGKVQPMAHDPLLGGYMIHFVRPRAVQVVSREAPKPDDVYSDVEAILYDMAGFAEFNVSRPLDVELAFADGAGI
jgi:DMSO/TMAO reductase YedYZ molybdopterin-dependent catalytic subunit